MNKKIFLFTALVGAMNISSAQTASDYYIPLCVGNQTVLRTEDGPNWEGRLTTYSIIKTDTIGGIEYVVKEGKEYTFRSPTVPHPFQYFWFREDVNGEVLVKAYGDISANLADAVILPTEGIYFSNNHLTVGYSVTYTTGPGETSSDSVLTNSASFGPFGNCIQIRETNTVSGVVTLIEDKFYVYGIGEVGAIRVFPSSQSHTAQFATTYITGCNPIVDTLSTQVVDTCFAQYFDYYISNPQIDSINKTITVNWVFQDSLTKNEFEQTYNYLYQGNNVIGITIQCTRSVDTYYKTVNIGSLPSGISELGGLNASVKIYPNPAAEQVSFALEGRDNSNLIVNIYDAIGQLIYSKALQQVSEQIKLSELSTGIYVIEIKSNTWSEKQKLIIQR